jgi:Zn-dependent protease with chaperone function
MSLLFECSVRAVLVAGAVAAVVHGLRIANARARHLAWCGVLAAMLLLPAFSAWGPKATLRVLPRAADAPTADLWTPMNTSSSALSIAPPILAQPSVEPRPLQPGPDLLWIAYLVVAGLLLIRLLHGATRAASIRRRAQPEEGFLSSPQCVCPFTVGWWRPAIVLPTTWTEWPKAELEAVLTHERAHVRRRDPLVQWLAALNRCIFWFHPLAWWLERTLSALAEEACDAAAISCGHDPRDYSEYLIHQAREVERAGARVAIGSAIGGGVLAHRIRLLLDPRPTAVLSRSRAGAGAALCIFFIAAFTACRLDRAEKPMAGQPTMNELAHRRAESNRQYQEHQKAILDRAHSLTADQAQQLFASLKENPQDADNYWTLVRHYEFQANAKDLDALKLWYIEHQPGGKLWGGNIDPRVDRAGYEKGKAFWLANVKQPGAAAEIYQRAADFLEGGDKPLAGSILEAGRKAYPNDDRWPPAFGRHYAQVLLGSAEPVTEYNVFRKVSSQEAQSAYAQTVRAQLAGSRDAHVLAQTAQYLLAWGRPHGPAGTEGGSAALQLARAYIDRALSIEPEDKLTRSMKVRLSETENFRRLQQLIKMPPAELSSASASDRMLLAMHLMREAAIRQNFADAESKARELLDLAAHNQNDPLYGEAVFEANMVMGKAALRRGDRKTSARYLLAAAETPGSERIRRGDFEMNLPRALVDWGERRAVADFFRRMAPKTARTKQFQDWAADLSKGINPDLIPTFSAPGCTNDPC